MTSAFYLPRAAYLDPAYPVSKREAGVKYSDARCCISQAFLASVAGEQPSNMEISHAGLGGDVVRPLSNSSYLVLLHVQKNRLFGMALYKSFPFLLAYRTIIAMLRKDTLANR